MSEHKPDREAALAAIREYTEALMRGEEPEYPAWADEVIKERGERSNESGDSCRRNVKDNVAN